MTSLLTQRRWAVVGGGRCVWELFTRDADAAPKSVIICPSHGPSFQSSGEAMPPQLPPFCPYCNAASSEFVLDDSSGQWTCTSCGSQLGGFRIDFSRTGESCMCANAPVSHLLVRNVTSRQVQRGGASRCHRARECTRRSSVGRTGWR